MLVNFFFLRCSTIDSASWLVRPGTDLASAFASAELMFKRFFPSEVTFRAADQVVR